MIQRLDYILSRDIDSPLGQNSVFYETFVVPPELKESYPQSENTVWFIIRQFFAKVEQRFLTGMKKILLSLITLQFITK